MSSGKNQLLAIQYLRAIAALMVVAHHARGDTQAWLFNPLEAYPALAWGVDIFFVISGFIMYVAARNDAPIDFLGKRLIRIAPLYWLSTLAAFVVVTRFQVWKIDAATVEHLIKSILFIPHYNPTAPDQIWPYLVPGWTLNYEMFFYGIFFLALMVRRTLLLPTLTLSALFLVGLSVDTQNAAVRSYTDPILLEFLAGAWIGYVYTKGWLHKYCSPLMVAGLILLFALPLVANDQATIAGRIIASAMIIVGAASLGAKTPNWKLLKLLGDASYAIYLTHAVISLRLSLNLWSLIPISGYPQFIGSMITALALSAAIGVAVHLYFEKPLTHWLRTQWALRARKTPTERDTKHAAPAAPSGAQ